MATHELHSSPETCHWGYFDSQLKPSLRIKSGDIATIHCLSGSAEILPKPPMNVLPEHREVLLLREVEDMSYREIADVTQVAIGTVMSRLARARAALKVQWREQTKGAPRAVR